MSTRIMLVFEHPTPTTCDEIAIDIHLPLPDPIVEAAEAMAARVQPACPFCKQPMHYIGFNFENADEKDAPQ